MGWERGSVRAALAGGEPTLLPAASPVESHRRELERRLSAIYEEFGREAFIAAAARLMAAEDDDGGVGRTRRLA
jgi:hypothetical protein